VDGLEADDPGHLGPADQDGEPREDPGVDAPAGLDPEEACIGVAGHHEADLVHVRVEHHPEGPPAVVRAAGPSAAQAAVPEADEVAHGVGPDLVHVGLEGPAEDLADLALVTGQPAGLGEFFQKTDERFASLSGHHLVSSSMKAWSTRATVRASRRPVFLRSSRLSVSTGVCM